MGKKKKDANRKTCGPCNDVKVNLIKMTKAFIVLELVFFFSLLADFTLSHAYSSHLYTVGLHYIGKI